MNRIQKLLLVASAMVISAMANAQTAITVTSDREDVRFVLIIDGQTMNDFFETWVNVKNVPSGFHEVRVLFERDSAADYVKNMSFSNGSEKIYTISEKKEFKKKVNATGRNLGKKADIGTHDAQFDYLLDIYDLKQTGKEVYNGNGSTELEVSTEKTLSTSILPASRER